MSRHYFSYEEEQAYKEGRHDEERHRRDYSHDRYAFDGEDRAYWDGRKDEEHDEHEHREREEQERMEEERMERQREERRREDEEYEMYLQSQIEQQENLQSRKEQEMPKPDENCQPITEEELFMQIEKDERNTTLSDFDGDNE